MNVLLLKFYDFLIFKRLCIICKFCLVFRFIGKLVCMIYF